MVRARLAFPCRTAMLNRALHGACISAIISGNVRKEEEEKREETADHSIRSVVAIGTFSSQLERARGEQSVRIIAHV